MFSPQRFVIKFLILAAMLLGLPLIGVYVAGFPVARYLEFPPQTRYVQHAPFSWPAFFVIVFLIVASVLPPAIKGIQSYRKTPHPAATPTAYPFPWWGWIGIFSGMIAWVLALSLIHI